MADHIRIIEEAISFFGLSTRNYVSRWQRNHTRRLLREYVDDIKYKENLLAKLQEGSLSSEMASELQRHLSEEMERVKDSELRMQHELEAAREELEAEREKNKRYQSILKQMLEFIKVNRDSFFTFVLRRGIVVDLPTFDEIMDSLSVNMLVDICENLELLTLK